MAEARYPSMVPLDEYVRGRNLPEYGFTRTQGVDLDAPAQPAATAALAEDDFIPDEEWSGSGNMDPHAAVNVRDGGYGTLLGIGTKQVAQSFLGVLDLAGVDTSSMQDSLKSAIEKDVASLSRVERERLQAKWLAVGEGSVLGDPMAIVTQTITQLPTVATMLVPSLTAARVASTAARASNAARATAAGEAAGAEAVTAAGRASQWPLSESAMSAAQTAGKAASADAAGKVAATAGTEASRAAGAAAGVVGGVTEGGIVAGATNDQIRQAVMDTPRAIVETMPEYLRLIDSGLSDVEAREAIAEQLEPTALTTGAMSGLIGAIGQAYLGKVLFGAPGGTRLGNTGKGFLAEGPLTEGPQSALEAEGAASAIQQVDPTYDPETGEQTVAGSVIGGVIGGGIAAMGPTQRRETTPGKDAVVDADFEALKKAEPEIWKDVSSRHDMSTPEGRMRADIEFSKLVDEPSRERRPGGSQAIGEAAEAINAKKKAAKEAKEAARVAKAIEKIKAQNPQKELTDEEVLAALKTYEDPADAVVDEEEEEQPPYVPESQATIDAQMDAVADPTSAKDTMTVTEGSPSPSSVPAGVSKVEIIGPGGAPQTLYTTDKTLAAQVEERGDLTDRELGAVLYGRPEGKEGSQGVALVARNAEGLPVAEVLTSPETFQQDLATVVDQMPAGGLVELSTVAAQLKERLTLAEAEQSAVEDVSNVNTAAAQAAQAAASRVDLEQRAEAERADVIAGKASLEAVRAVAADVVTKFFASRTQIKGDAETGGRDNVGRDEAGTKIAAAVALKRALNEFIKAALDSGVIPPKSVDLIPASKRVGATDRAPLDRVMAQLFKALGGKQRGMADALYKAISSGDSAEIQLRIDGFIDAMQSTDPETKDLLGTPYEPLETQVARGTRRAREYAARPVSRGNRPQGVPKFEWVTAVRSLHRAVMELHKAMQGRRSKNSVGYAHGYEGEAGTKADKVMAAAAEATKLMNTVTDESLKSGVARNAYNKLIEAYDLLLASPGMGQVRERDAALKKKARGSNQPKRVSRPKVGNTRRAKTLRQHETGIRNLMTQIRDATSFKRVTSLGEKLSRAVIEAGGTQREAQDAVAYAYQQRAKWKKNNGARTLLEEEEIYLASKVASTNAFEEIEQERELNPDVTDEELEAEIEQDVEAEGAQADEAMSEENLENANRERFAETLQINPYINKLKELWQVPEDEQRKPSNIEPLTLEQYAEQQAAAEKKAADKAEREAKEKAAKAAEAIATSKRRSARGKVTAAVEAPKPPKAAVTPMGRKALGSVFSIAKALRPDFLSAKAFGNYLTAVRGTSALIRQVFGTEAAPSPVAQVVAAFKRSLTPEQLADFNAMVATYAAPRSVNPNEQQGDLALKAELSQQLQAIQAFVEATGLTVPADMQYRIETRTSAPQEALVDVEAAVAAATPEGAQKPFLPAIADARMKAKRDAEATNKAITERNERAARAFRPETTHTYTSDPAGAKKVSLAQLVSEYVEATREVVYRADPALDKNERPVPFSALFNKESPQRTAAGEEAQRFYDTVNAELAPLAYMPTSMAELLAWVESSPTMAAAFRAQIALIRRVVPADMLITPYRGGVQMGTYTRAFPKHAAVEESIRLSTVLTAQQRLVDVAHTMLHELAHAAMTNAIEGVVMKDPATLASLGMTAGDADAAIQEMTAMLGAARAFADKYMYSVYGLTDINEFMAELYSSASFRAFLSKVPAAFHRDYNSHGNIRAREQARKEFEKRYRAQQAADRSLLQRVFDWIAGLFGHQPAYPPIPPEVVERVLTRADSFFMSLESKLTPENRLTAIPAIRKDIEFGGSAARRHPLLREVEQLPTKFAVEAFLKQSNPSISNPLTAKAARSAVSNTATAINERSGFGDKLQRAHLGYMNFDFMERKYRQLDERLRGIFKSVKGPLARIIDATTSASMRARNITDTHVELSRETAALEHEERQTLYRAMIDSTMAGVHIDRSLMHPSNAHLFKKNGDMRNAAAVIKALQTRDELSDRAMRLYKRWRHAMEQERATRIGVLVSHAALTRGMTKADADALFKTVMNGADANAIESAVMKQANANNVAQEDLEDLATTLRDIVSESTVEGPYFPLQREGEWSVVSEDGGKTLFEMYDNEHEANAARDAHRAAGVRTYVTKSLDAVTNLAPQQVQRLADEIRKRSTRLSTKGMTDEQKKAYHQFQSNIQNAVHKILASRTLYSSRLKRKYVAGALTKDMAKALEGHSRASISVVSMLDGAFEYNAGLRDLRDAAKNVGLQAEGDLSQDEQVLVGNIYNEVLMRSDTLASDRDVTTMDRVLGRLGFFTYLGAPSYWLLNATQTAVVGMPVLAGHANVSAARATRALRTAYSEVRQLTKGMGWRALTDLNAVIAKMPAEKQEIIRKLIDDNAIQSTLAHEIGVLSSADLSLTQTKAGRWVTPVYNGAVDILQAVPDVIERFNRLSMALAAMDAGVTDYTQIKDIVLASQFNYDTANRARLLKTLPKWAGGGGRHIWAPMMMFKVFGVQMAELVYGNLYDGFMNKAKTPEERARARKIFYGIISTHTVFGGLTGGLGLGLGSIVLSAVNGFLDDEDKIEPQRALMDFLTEHTGEYAASIVMKGAPAALGADFSSATNLGNLLWMSRDTDWAQYGGFEQSVYSALGPIAQYVAGGLARPAAQLAEGEIGLGRFLETAVPLKLYKGLSQAFRTQVEGLETHAGQAFLKPEDVSLWSSGISALGLRPTTVSMAQERFYGDRARGRALEDRKAQVLAQVRDASNAEERAAAREAWNAWNADMRERKNFSLVITQRQVDQSRKRRKQVADDYAKGKFTPYN